MSINRSVITIAVGRPYYLKLAENLLNSFLIWNGGNDIHFLLITDNTRFFDKYKGNSKVTIQQINLSETDKSFTSKFKLFEQAIATDNLFIDCDCLIYKDISFVFDAFKGRSFSTIGNDIVGGEFFCDVKKTLDHFKITAMPKFVGSVYYFKKDDKAQHIFETASELKNRYDELGFVRLRDKENEEPLFAVAMQLENESLINNPGAIKADLMYYKSIVSDVLAGKAFVSKPILEITGGEKIPDDGFPAILHFNGSYSESYHYKIEAFRLNHQNLIALNLAAFIKIKLPYIIKAGLKNSFRPVYHFLLGYRKIEKSKRIA
jgi:hypothetical protein